MYSKDAEIEGIKINTLPMDSIQIDKGGNKIAVGTNLDGNSNMEAVVKKLDEVVSAVRSASNLNVAVEYDSFKAANPNAKFQDIGKIISAQWKALSEDEKQVYKDKANEINTANGFTVTTTTPKKKATKKKKTPTAPKKAKKKAAKKKQEPVEEETVSTSDIDDIVDELDDLVEEYESN